MALNRVHDLYSLRWQRGLSRAAQAAMDAQIALYEVEERVYYPDTDSWNQTTTTWYTGAARIQPLRTARETGLRGNESTIQTVLVSIPISENHLDFRPGLSLQVTESALNPSLVDYIYVLRDVVDSSNPFERTLLCTVDQEDRSDG